MLFRLLLVIPAAILSGLVTAGQQSLSLAVVLMLLFRRRYPEPWFRWALYMNQYSLRVGAYMALLVDDYPSTTDAQRVTTDATLDESRLNRWLPLVKWLLALPHYLVLAVLGFVMVFVLLIAWVIIVITGRFPRGLHGYVTGVLRWAWRVNAYAFLLSTDRYPPFSLSADA